MGDDADEEYRFGDESEDEDDLTKRRNNVRTRGGKRKGEMLEEPRGRGTRAGRAATRNANKRQRIGLRDEFLAEDDEEEEGEDAYSEYSDDDYNGESD